MKFLYLIMLIGLLVLGAMFCLVFFLSQEPIEVSRIGTDKEKAKALSEGDPLITFEVEMADMSDVLKYFAAQSGTSIVVDSDLSARLVNASLEDVPLSICLDVILEPSGYTYRRVGKTLVLDKPDRLSDWPDWDVIRGQHERITNALEFDPLITLSVQQTEMIDVLKFIAAQSGTSVVVSPDVPNSLLTIDLQEVPLGECLEVILRPHYCGYRRIGKTIVVDTVDGLEALMEVDEFLRQQPGLVDSLGEDPLITLRVVQQADMKDVLNSIEAQSEFSFEVDPDLAGSKFGISIDLQDVPLSELLDRILGPRGYGYRVSGKTIVIDKRDRLLKSAEEEEE